MTIAIATVGAVAGRHVEITGEAIARQYGLHARCLGSLPIPMGAFEPKRNQYNAVLLMRDLVNRRPVGCLKLLALTPLDIFIPMLTFLFGQAQLGGGVALVSLARLKQEFFGLPADPAVTDDRLVKEVVHEVGHAFGLIHCTDFRCPMSLSTTIREVDLKGSSLCSRCAATVSGNILKQNMES